MSEKKAETIISQTPLAAVPKRPSPRKGSAILKTGAKSKAKGKAKGQRCLAGGASKKAETAVATLSELLNAPFVLDDTPFDLGPIDIGAPEPTDFEALKALEAVDISPEALRAGVEARLGDATAGQIWQAKRLVRKWRGA